MITHMNGDSGRRITSMTEIEKGRRYEVHVLDKESGQEKVRDCFLVDSKNQNCDHIIYARFDNPLLEREPIPVNLKPYFDEQSEFSLWSA